MSQTLSVDARQNKRVKSKRIEQILALFAIVSLAAAGIFGVMNSGEDIASYLPELFPGATAFKQSGSIYIAVEQAAGGVEKVLGFATPGRANGYAGPVTVLVGVDPTGQIVGVRIISQKETPSFFKLIVKDKFIDRLVGRSATDPLQLGKDLDAVSGATFTSRAIADGLRQASHTIAVDQLGVTPFQENHPLEWGWPEVTLVGLYIAGYLAHRPGFPARKAIRWGTLIAGMVLLGFVFNRPLTLANIASLLSGYWPDWRTNLYWFLLIGGIFLIATVDGKNAYCTWFCPFGAAQECLGALGKARKFQPKRGRLILVWIQRGLAWLALMLALALRRPGLATYEPFQALFQFKGSNWLFGLLVITLLASFVIFRPWCNFLCPMNAVFDLIAAVRRWMVDLWRKNPAKPSLKS